MYSTESLEKCLKVWMCIRHAQVAVTLNISDYVTKNFCRDMHAEQGRGTKDLHRLNHETILQGVTEHDNKGENIEDIEAQDILAMANEAPIIKVVNNIFMEAINKRASDIHIESPQITK